MLIQNFSKLFNSILSVWCLGLFYPKAVRAFDERTPGEPALLYNAAG